MCQRDHSLFPLAQTHLNILRYGQRIALHFTTQLRFDCAHSVQVINDTQRDQRNDAERRKDNQEFGSSAHKRNDDCQTFSV